MASCRKEFILENESNIRAELKTISTLYHHGDLYYFTCTLKHMTQATYGYI